MTKRIILIFTLLTVLFTINSVYSIETDTITLMLENVLSKENGREEFIKKYRELKGINLDIYNPSPGNYTGILREAIKTDKNAPEIIELNNYHINILYRELIRDGYLVSLDTFINNSEYLKDIDKKYLDVLKVNGNIYGFPVNRGIGAVTYIRKDWLDNLGLKIPNTWDELYEVMREFTYNDPDKNGMNDTIGYSLPRLKEEVMYIADFYQGATDNFDYIDGKWVDGFVQQNFKKALKNLQQAYREKLIDRDFFTNSLAMCRSKFYEGKTGIISFQGNHWAEVLDRNLKLNDPNAKVIAIPCIEGSNYWAKNSSILVITKVAKNPEKIFRNIIEFMYDGGQGQMLFTHGVNGVHYQIENGKYAKLPTLANPNNIFIPAELALNKWNDPFPLHQSIVAAREAFEGNYKYIPIKPNTKTYLQHKKKIEQIKEEIIVKISIDEYTIDEGIEIYKQKSKELEIDKILKEFNDRL